jgi:hypothetical protein
VTTDGDIYLQIRADERRINDIKLKQTLVRICKRIPELPSDTPLSVIMETAFKRGDPEAVAIMNVLLRDEEAGGTAAPGENMLDVFERWADAGDRDAMWILRPRVVKQ